MSQFAEKQKAATTARPLTEALGVRGWSHLDALILAALTLRSPVLLVGAHGTAKSLLVERVAQALGLTFRHYNASLLNYDDLVGIPMPDEASGNLRFFKTRGNIWDAGFVFFDEISRCRADLQNKLFPIVYERRIIGIDLEQLQHRWAAMNPPAPDVIDISATADHYIGSEPLDTALADRFHFIIPVPRWGDLSRVDRLHIVSYGDTLDCYADIELDLPLLITQATANLPLVECACAEWLSDYVICLMDALEQAGLRQETRRARTLACNVIAVHAARMVLEQVEAEDADALEESAACAVLYSIPANATDAPPSPVKLRAIHRQAWELMSYMDDDNWRRVLEESDKLRRVALADTLGFSDDDLSTLITQALADEPSDIRQMGMATAMFLAFCERRDLNPSTYEPLTQLADHILAPSLTRTPVTKGSSQASLLDEIEQWLHTRCSQSGEDTLVDRLLRNFLMFGFPSLWENHNWHEAVSQFHSDLTLFGVTDASAAQGG